MDVFLNIFNDPTLQIVLLGAVILGITTGSLGAFAVLRQQSLLGDAISHATLPGICLGFLLTQSKNPLLILLGAGIAGWIGTLFLLLITNNTRIKRDAALGLVLSVFFGFGLMLLTIIQRLPTATKAGLDKFLFGSVATILREDILTMITLSAIIFSLLLLFWKEFKLLTFDPDYAQSQGLRVRFFDIFLTTLIVAAIVVGLQIVGVVLMSAMLVAPAAAARQWTDKLEVMVFLSAFFGALAGVFGVVASSLIPNLPTGPTIVVVVTIFVIGSLIFAPNRGLLWDYLRTYEHRRQIRTTTMLKNLLLFPEVHTDNPFHPHDIAALKAIGRGAIDQTMNDLEKRGWAKQFPDGRWALTPQGLSEAQRLTTQFEAGFDDKS